MSSMPGKIYYPGLDGLRGVAILLVVVYHYFPFFRIGWIGVDLFFVLSGFLITSILIRTKDKKHYFRNFYIRRALRILPVYFLFLLAFYLGLETFFEQRGPSSAYSYYAEHQVWFLTFLQNWLIIKEGPPPEPYLIHFWSLAVEEQFYLFWPLVIFFIRDTKRIKTLLLILFSAAIALRLFLWFTYAPNQAFYYNSFARFDSLSAGSFLAILVYEGLSISSPVRKIVAGIFVTFLLTAWLAYNSFEHHSFLFATIGYSISAVFFMVCCYTSLTYVHSFHNKLLQFFGRISYGVYVFHLPVYLAGSSILTEAHLFSDQAAGILIPWLCLAFTILVSFISYRLIELPFLKLKSKFT